MNTNYNVYNLNPLVASAYLYPEAAKNRAILRDREAYVLFFFFNYETPMSIAATLAMIRRDYPKIRFRAAVDRLAVVWWLHENGFNEVVYAHQNALIDDRIYRPIPAAKPLYNAVYNAGTTAGKRHHLADEIPNWLWITYMPNGGAGYDYFHETRAELKNVRIPQWAGGRYWYWDNKQVAHCLNEAPVGLCLTEHEGGMWAASEYALAGLPVVGCFGSLGGHNTVIEQDYSIFVQPHPLQVAGATRELIRRNIPRQQIREAQQALLRPHLDAIQSALQELFDLAGVKRDVRGDWHRIFFDKMYRWGASPLTAAA